MTSSQNGCLVHALKRIAMQSPFSGPQKGHLAQLTLGSADLASTLNVDSRTIPIPALRVKRRPLSHGRMLHPPLATNWNSRPLSCPSQRQESAARRSARACCCANVANLSEFFGDVAPEFRHTEHGAT